MRKYFVYPVYFLLVFNLILSSCSPESDSNDTNSIGALSITTIEASLINKTTAKVGGVLLSAGGQTVISRGVCYSTNPNPTIEDTIISNPGWIGTFVCQLTGLTAATQYYVRAYASNPSGLVYGQEITFTTTTEALSPPFVTTTEASEITQTVAISGGEVISAGGTEILARGICWATTENPSLLDNVVDAPGTTGVFSSSIIGLDPATTYYVRAFATNSVGTSYGNQITFTTASDATGVLPTIETFEATDLTQTNAVSGGNVISIGDSPLTARGICWSITDNPTITDNVITDPATTTGEFISLIEGLTPGTTYYVKAFATNATGTSYGDLIFFTTPL